MSTHLPAARLGHLFWRGRRCGRHVRCFATVLGGTTSTPFAHKTWEQSQTLVEKIVQKYAVDLPEGKVVRSGDIISIRPSHVMTHDNTGAVLPKFRSIGAKQIKRPSQIVFTLDHDIQNTSEKNLTKYATIEAFAREQNVDFYPAGRGIGHQVMVEEGYAFPYGLAVASDSHTNMYGAVGCLGTPVVRTDAAALWATGQTWWQIPEIVKVELKGQLSPGVTGKDVIISLASYFNHDEVLNAAVEFTGSGIRTLAIDERLAISNMTTEWGALVGLFPVDDILISWYEKLIKRMQLARFEAHGKQAQIEHPRLNEARLQQIIANPMAADPSAFYKKHLTIDLSTLVPHVSGPNSVKIATALPELEARDIKINKAYLVSCTNSRVSDIKAAADVMRNHKVAPGVEFYVAAASSLVQADAEADGAWGDLIAAGAKTLPAGCGPCIGLGTGLLEDGEVGISATNRNYKGRMGSPKSTAYLASPAVVAASAIAGKITGPKGLSGQPSASLRPSTSMIINEPPDHAFASAPASPEGSQPIASLLPRFPPRFAGPLVFVHQDNLNTDGIYPGKYTYNDAMTPDDMARVCMENYDKAFVEKATHPDTILIGGFNFGTGSSREQAATALKSRGIKLVIAGSFGDIFKRNAINNGLICVECPDLVADLISRHGREELTVVTGQKGSYDCISGRLDVEGSSGNEFKTYQLRSVSPSVQEIYVADGLEGWVRQRL